MGAAVVLVLLKEVRIMNKVVVDMYNIGHMENMLEIGRIIQYHFDMDKLDFYESKEMFADALTWAVEFEETADLLNGDYYTEILLFTEKKLKEKFGDEWRA
jgi:hypothetical protein